MKIKLILILVFLLSLNNFAQTNPGETEGQKLLNEITANLKERKFDEVIVKANRLIELFPKSGDIYTFRGIALYSRGEKEKAVADFTKALELGIGSAFEMTTYQMRALSFFQLKRYDEAIKDFNFILEKEPADFRGFVYRGWCYYHQGKYEPAVKDFDAALKLDPNQVGIRRYRAVAHHNLGNYEKAVQDATDEMRLSPKESESYKIRAAAYRKLGKTELAEADEKTYAAMSGKAEAVAAENSKPTSEDKLKALLAQAEAQFDKKQWDSVIKTYNEIIGLIGEDADGVFAIYFSRGRAFYEKGDSVSAMNDYNRVIKLKPNLSGGYTFRGELYLQKKQFDLALQDFTKAQELNPQDLLAYRRRAEVFYLTKEYDKAIEDASKVIKLDAKYQTGWYYRAVSYLAKGEYQRAVNDFNEYLTLEPDDAEVYSDRARAFRKLGKIKEAEADEKKASELKPKN